MYITAIRQLVIFCYINSGENNVCPVSVDEIFRSGLLCPSSSYSGKQSKGDWKQFAATSGMNDNYRQHQWESS